MIVDHDSGDEDRTVRHDADSCAMCGLRLGHSRKWVTPSYRWQQMCSHFEAAQLANAKAEGEHVITCMSERCKAAAAQFSRFQREDPGKRDSDRYFAGLRERYEQAIGAGR